MLVFALRDSRLLRGLSQDGEKTQFLVFRTTSLNFLSKRFTVRIKRKYNFMRVTVNSPIYCRNNYVPESSCTLTNTLVYEREQFRLFIRSIVSIHAIIVQSFQLASRDSSRAL